MHPAIIFFFIVLALTLGIPILNGYLRSRKTIVLKNGIRFIFNKEKLKGECKKEFWEDLLTRWINDLYTKRIISSLQKEKLTEHFKVVKVFWYTPRVGPSGEKWPSIEDTNYYRRLEVYGIKRTPEEQKAILIEKEFRGEYDRSSDRFYVNGLTMSNFSNIDVVWYGNSARGNAFLYEMINLSIGFLYGWTPETSEHHIKWSESTNNFSKRL